MEERVDRGIKKIMKKSKLYVYLYLLFWIVPLFLFVKDFFEIEVVKYIDVKEILELFKISLVQGTLSVIFATLIALVPAHYISSKSNALSKMLEGLIFIPFFFPTISTVVAFTLIFNLPFFKEYQILYTLKAIIVANIFYNSPIMIKYISQGLKSIPKEIVEAGSLDGLNDAGLFFKIKIPLIFPQIFRGMFLVFIYTFASFGIVLALGGLRYSNLEVEIANVLIRDANFSKALILGGVQFLFLITINIFGEKIPKYEISENFSEKKVNIFSTIYSSIYLLLEYSVIVIGIIYGFYNFYTGKFSLVHFLNLFNSEFNERYPILEGIANSLFLASIASIFIVIFAYLLLKNFTKMTGVFIFSTIGFSSAFLGLTLVYLNILYDIKTWILLVIGYFLITVPIAYSFMYQYVIEFSKDILELSILDNLSFIKRFYLIEFPILKKVFIATYFQIFAIILGEFTISYSMQLGKTFPTIALVNYSLYTDKKILEGAALSSLNIVFVAVLFYISTRLNQEIEKE